MSEHLNLGIGEKIGLLADKLKNKDKKIDVETELELAKSSKDKRIELKNNLIESSLRTLATRIVTAKSIGELSGELRKVNSELGGGKDVQVVDGLRSAVMMKVETLIKDDAVGHAKVALENSLKNHDVSGAVKLLEELVKQDEYKMSATQQNEVGSLLKSVKELHVDDGRNAKVVEARIKLLNEKEKKLSEGINREFVDIKKNNDEIEANLAKDYLKQETNKMVSKKEPKVKVEVKKTEIKKLSDQAEKIIDRTKNKNEKEDSNFVKKLLSGGNKGFGSVDSSGNLVIDMDKFNHQDAVYMYGRVNTALGRYKSKLSDPNNAELQRYLEELQFELHERLAGLETEQREVNIAKGMVGGEVDPVEQAKMMANFDFMKRYGSADALSEYAKQEGMSRSKTEHHIKQLIKAKPELANKFKFTEEGILWDERSSPEEFFELCRQEIYRIKDSVPEEQLGQLMFVDEAQLYLALMGVSAKGNPEIRQAKDAVTKMLYMEFALKSLWKAGGNHEAWQRAAGLLLRDEAGTNFFVTMKIRERLRGKDAKGKNVAMPGFNVDDMMTFGELEAPNGQSWLAYISTDSIEVNESRLQELGNGLAKMTLEKARLRIDEKTGKRELSNLEYAKYSSLLKNNEIAFDKEQLDWVRNYMQYVHTATLNVGEKLWLMDGTKPGDKGFEYASLPGGQFAEKSGLWGQLYFAKYQVTKYGFERLGKLFIPNPGLLSYARKETLRHFISAKGNEEWLKDPDGVISKPGGGAKDFFFGGKDIGEDKLKAFTSFWEEVWFDSRTGKSLKSKGMRSLKNSRDVGSKLMIEGKHREFVAGMEFSQLEKLMGYKIPGNTNEAKLSWVVENLDYGMMEMKSMPSKREGDWVNKYSKYYVETVTFLQNFLDAPTLANKMKILESIAKYNSETLPNISRQLDEFMADNRKFKVGLKEGGNPLNPNHWIGPEVASGDIKDLKRSEDGDNMEMPMVHRSATDGWYWGRGLKFTRQQYKEGTNDPMVMRKIEIQNAIAWGVVSPQEGGQMMRDWQKMIYFGEQINLGKLKIRPGAIPFLTPYFLARGWWVDRMGMDWEDFKMISRKQNEEAWTKLKKLLGIEF